MKRSAFLWLSVPALLLSTLAAQTPVSAKASGECNTAIAGGSGNKITISCSGISATQASKLTVLMNRILAEHMDLSEVTSKLDQISSEMNSLNKAINPLGEAPKSARDLLTDGDSLMTSCSAISSRWSGKNTSRQMDQIAAMQNQAARLQANASVIDQQFAPAFQAKFGPRIDALLARYRRAMPDETNFPDYHSVQHQHDIVGFNYKMSDLYNRYLMELRTSGGALDPAIAKEDLRLSQDLMDYFQSSGKSEATAKTAAYPGNYLALTQPDTSSEDEEELQLYRKTIEPNLIAWREKVLLYVPTASDNTDFDSVHTAMQLNNVCRDIISLRLVLQTKIYRDLQDK
ncbi:MAG TPA: hypothetical protein VK716_01910 [Terracidiphilus sp.]|jgi:hypothetical protein|nr:hypothetical protein [Terracidiphilus sp.]